MKRATNELQRGWATARVLPAILALAGCQAGPPPVGQPAGQPAAPVARPELDAASVERFARLALSCLHQEYPNKLMHVLNDDGDARPPRLLTPVFYGCFDWHSAVHGHWLLVRLLRLYPDAAFAAEARAALAKSFTAEKVAGEIAYMAGPGRATFERPYGLAWLLQLCAELREWKSPEAQLWANLLEPLEARAARELASWLPKLSYPVRSGEHSQTAFALGLALDWARSRPDPGLEQLIIERARVYHVADRGCSLAFEPGGQDFLSPCLAEADLMRRVLPSAELADWLSGFMPVIPTDGSAAWLAPAVVTDASDGKLAHLDGLNASRAWMLDGVAQALPAGDARLGALRAAADAHAVSALRAVTGAHYEGGHWLGSFAVYLVTHRGLGPQS